MLRLITLGGLTLTDDRGDPVLSQRRRLALLAILAVAGHPGVSRDRLVADLWPESPDESARHALEQHVYWLRRQLAAPAVAGTDPLRLHSDVWTDVGEFEHRLGTGDAAGALALYRGPFLDGFFLSEAPEFERWAERERSRLAATHARALRVLADEARNRGRHADEIDYRRQLAAANPLHEGAAADLVRALAAADDWAGALRTAREYDARLREELPQGPRTDLESLVREIQDARLVPTGRTDGAESRYAIERELGRGAAAIVYLARDRRFDRPVALKLLLPAVATATDARRFRREIAILARLQHPHIVPLFDSGVLSGDNGLAGLFYVMAYVRGPSLRERLARDGQLTIDAALSIARDVAEALDHAHAHGVVHRDVRPENLLLEAGHALVTDFGIAAVLENAAGERLSQSGVVLSAPEYSSPEQARGGRALDGRSDLYSLGCVLYEMLGGKPPFHEATRAATLTRHAADPPPPLRTVRPDVPTAIERAVARLLAKRPEDRFATGADLTLALQGRNLPA